MQHDALVSETVKLAWSAREKGNHPFGALLVLGPKIVMRAENTVVTENDATQHAELNLVSAASRALSKDDLAKAVLVSSTEPCAMCAGAIYWAGIRSVVYGLSAAGLSDYASGSFVVSCRDVFEKGRDPVSVEGPVNVRGVGCVHDGFW